MYAGIKSFSEASTHDWASLFIDFRHSLATVKTDRCVPGPQSPHKVFIFMDQCVACSKLFHWLPEMWFKKCFPFSSACFALSCLQLSPHELCSVFFPKHMKYDRLALCEAAWCVQNSLIGFDWPCFFACCGIFLFVPSCVYHFRWSHLTSHFFA